MRRTMVLTPFTCGTYVSVTSPIRMPIRLQRSVNTERRAGDGLVTTGGCYESNRGSLRREEQSDRGATSQGTLGGDATAVGLHEVLHNRQSQSGSPLRAGPA